MGAKESKVPKPKEIHVSEDQLIDPSDATLFPKAVRDELMAVKQEVSPTDLVLVKEFNQSSALVQWLRQSKGYFDFNLPSNEENENANYTFEYKPKPKTTSVNKNKDPFLYRLEGMCNAPYIETKFLANLLEMADRFLFAFLNTGHIAGFMIFGEETRDGKRCLHRYITCTGPRRLGIGAALVKEVHAIAKREGFSCVTLGSAGAEEFHTKQGYKATGKKTLEGPEMIYQIPKSGGKRRSTRKQRRM
jgi:GNAT superfamily N-acetyltransferase